MSVEELQAHIAKISADIELQKAVLKNLELSKIFVQRQLNSVRDPVARLPLEISSEIFIQCLPPLPFPPGAHRIPMLLLNICSAWTDIALSTPALWASIRTGLLRTEGLRELVGTWLQCARNHPLSVSLTVTFARGLPPIILRHAGQLKHLEVWYKEDRVGSFGGPINILGSLSPDSPLSSLEMLKIRYSSDRGLGYGGSHILQLLRLTPNLIECMFDSVHYAVNSTAIQATLVLPSLRRLVVGNGTDDSGSDDDVLRHLTLPRLEYLSLSMYVNVGDELLPFLKRSSPPLRELALGDGLIHGDLDRIDECLRLVPTLTHFKLWCCRRAAFAQLSAALAESSSQLLPNIRTITIRIYSDATISDGSWDTLLRVLTARRTQIQTIRVKLQRASSKPAANVLASFKELRAAGMEVYIGTEKQNFCAV
ncbi:hypothetical protein B0H11DRAFT_2319680 [Mycena galericulata]|nr:hypothetical protein B0H11DRAFT_2319680 [Mycena galericulata]